MEFCWAQMTSRRLAEVGHLWHSVGKGMKSRSPQLARSSILEPCRGAFLSSAEVTLPSQVKAQAKGKQSRCRCPWLSNLRFAKAAVSWSNQ